MSRVVISRQSRFEWYFLTICSKGVEEKMVMFWFLEVTTTATSASHRMESSAAFLISPPLRFANVTFRCLSFCIRCRLIFRLPTRLLLEGDDSWAVPVYSVSSVSISGSSAPSAAGVSGVGDAIATSTATAVVGFRFRLIATVQGPGGVRTESWLRAELSDAYNRS